jgi:dihydroorotate dehydrogenase
VQIYTGLVYEGPAIAHNIVAGLQERLAERGLSSISNAVGIETE